MSKTLLELILYQTVSILEEAGENLAFSFDGGRVSLPLDFDLKSCGYMHNIPSD